MPFLFHYREIIYNRHTMKQRKLFIALLVTLLVMPTVVNAAAFSAVAPSGQTLYYTIRNGEAWVCFPSSTSNTYWGTWTKPTGDLVIPSVVNNGDITYDVTGIWSYAFYECDGLTSVSIPSSVTSIGQMAFGKCWGITNLIVPATVTEINSGAFTQVKSVSYDGSATGSPWGAINLNSYYEDGLYYTSSSKDSLVAADASLSAVVVPNEVKYIGQYAFYGCENMTSVQLGSNLNTIAANAFSECLSLSTINLPDSLKSIGSNAFKDCYSITNIIIPESVESLQSGCFANCLSLTTVYFNAEHCYGVEGVFTGCGSITEVIIGDGVKEIPDYLCKGMGGLTTVIIPPSVTSIGVSAFQNCANLSSVGFSNGLKTIGNSAFEGCSTLDAINIPNSVTNIGASAFKNCSSLNEVVLSDSLCFIAESLFFQCNLSSGIVLPESIVNIAHFAFYGTNLPQLVIPDAVSNIDYYAFAYCHSLTKAIIGNGVSALGESVFESSYNLNSVIFKRSVPPSIIQSHPPFTNCHPTIYIPCGTQNSYLGRWGINYSFQEALGFSFTANAESNGYVDYSNYVACDSTVTVSASSDYGYVFSHWSDGDYSSSRTLHLEGDSSITAYFSKQEFYISGLVEESDMGYVLGNGYVSYLDTATLVAMANHGYHFERWYKINNTGYYGNSIVTISYDDTLRVKASGSQTYYASFLPDIYTISLVSDNTTGSGSCSGDGEYEYPTTVAIMSTPDYGYRFSHWNDGDTNNPRVIALTQDTLFTAYYTKDTFAVYITYDSTKGTVAGDTAVAYGDSATLSATPHYGYHFSHWNIYRYQGSQLMAIDMVEDSTAMVQALGNIAIEAVFDRELFEVSLLPNIDGRGLADTVFEYYMLETMIEAVPNYGYHFSHWSDGDSTNPRLIVVTSDTSFTAVYEPDLFTLTLSSFDNSLGTVVGAGTYSYGDTVEIVAIPAEHYHLAYWLSSGYTYSYYYDNPQSVVITRDMTLQAYFDINTYTVSAQVDDVANGTVAGSGTYTYPSAATLTATAYSGYHFSHWSNGMLNNPYTLAVTRDTSITAIFIATGERYQDTIIVYDTVVVHDTVEYNIEYRDSVQYNIVVVDSTVYNIIQSDSVVYYYDTLCATHDTIVVTVHDTIYLTDPTGIDDRSAMVISIGVDGRSIAVGGVEGHTVQLYDSVGRLVATRRSLYDRVVFEAPTSGTYVVLVDGVAAHKAVVVR